MAMGSDIVFTSPLGGSGNGNGFFGGDAVGAFAGAALGSLFFNGGWGGWGNNGGGWNRGGGCGCNGGGMTGPIVINADDGHGHCSTAELDALSGIQSSINGLGLQLLQGQNASNLADCQGFSGVVNATNQGFSGLNNVVTTGNAAIQQSICQAAGGLNTAILTSSKDNALLNCQSTNAITSAIAECCCKTQNAIHAEGEATRGLIQQNYINSLQEKLCDCKSENSALKSQAYLAASQTAQTAQVQNAIDRQSRQFATVLKAYRAGRIDEREGTDPAGGAAA